MYWEGNRFFRTLIESNKSKYLAGDNRTKQQIAEHIVNTIRYLSPPGKFLEYNKHASGWRDIGNQKAVRKTRQALREGAQSKVSDDIYYFMYFVESMQRDHLRKKSNYVQLPSKK